MLVAVLEDICCCTVLCMCLTYYVNLSTYNRKAHTLAQACVELRQVWLLSIKGLQQPLSPSAQFQCNCRQEQVANGMCSACICCIAFGFVFTSCMLRGLRVQTPLSVDSRGKRVYCCHGWPPPTWQLGKGLGSVYTDEVTLAICMYAFISRMTYGMHRVRCPDTWFDCLSNVIGRLECKTQSASEAK